MKRVGVVLSILVLLGLTGAWALAATPGSSADVGNQMTLNFKLETEAVQFNDVDPVGQSLGDQLISRNKVLKQGEVVGHLGAVCTSTGGPGLTCIAIAALKEGQISISLQLRGSFLAGAGGIARFAVTGGTGYYAGARGTGTITQEAGVPTSHVRFGITV